MHFKYKKLTADILTRYLLIFARHYVCTVQVYICLMSNIFVFCIINMYTYTALQSLLCNSSFLSVAQKYPNIHVLPLLPSLLISFQQSSKTVSFLPVTIPSNLRTNLNAPVPTPMLCPMMIHSLTPSILSRFICHAASNRWSGVFSKLASWRTESRILLRPKRVMPRTSPLYVITSARSCMWRGSISMSPITTSISSMIVLRAASIPKTSRISITEFVFVLEPFTPSVVMQALRPYPSTSNALRPLSSVLMMARAASG